MNPMKAPGSDGMTLLFFQRYRTIIRPNLIKQVPDFFLKSIMSSELNSTFVALVPKMDHPTLVTHVRPLSLCNTIDKIISKNLATKIRSFLPRFISLYQSAFVQERIIQENFPLAAEAFHTIKHRKGKGRVMTIKVDIEKAFDRMEWAHI